MKMFRNSKKGPALNKMRGFTLIELLVVIAIIGILSSVVLASLNSARKKARDARRLGDIKQIQTALELYFDANDSIYPAGGYSALSSLVNGNFIPVLPSDPLAGQAYWYCTDSDGTTDATTYNLAATLEELSNPALSSDAGETITNCATGDTISTGADPIYNVKP